MKSSHWHDDDRYVHQSDIHQLSNILSPQGPHPVTVHHAQLSDDSEFLNERPRMKSSYIPALDGLRAFAVIAVVVYHLKTVWAPCGLLGVTIFFVLSGYLITGLIIDEWNATSHLSLKNFWLRRVRRLVPAIIFLLLCLIVLCAIFSPVMLTKLKQDLLSCLFFYNNWWQIFHDVSYFENLGSPSPVTHFWSLSIEEQFYIVWPVLLLLLFKIKTNKKLICALIVVLALLSAADMALLYVPGDDPSRVYYGTDTRAFSLLIGAFLAFVLPAARVRSEAFPKSARVVAEVAAFIALGIIAAMIFTVSAYEPFLYRGGYFGLSLLTAIIIIALVNSRGILAKIFALAPLVWIGERSYGLYLWHYPLLLLMNPPTDFAEKPWWVYVLQVAVILAVTEFSYHFVENPIRKGAIRKTLASISSHRATVGMLLERHQRYFGSAACLFAAAIIAAIVVPPTSAVQNGANYNENDIIDPSQALAQQANDQPYEGQQADQTGNANSEAPNANEDAGNAENGNFVPSPLVSESARAYLASLPAEPKDWRILLIGDSVTREAKEEFLSHFTQSFEDSVSNRNIIEGTDALRTWIDEGWEGDVVVISLGANVVTTDEDYLQQYNALLAEVPENIPIFVMNIRTPGISNYNNNRLIEQIASDRDDVFLVDWYNLTADHSDWFESDGTHLNQTGTQGFVSLLEEVLRSYRAEAAALA